VSDTIPTPEDKAVAKEILTSDGEYDTEKISNEVARQRRVGIEQNSDIKKVLSCLEGDDMGMSQGLIKEQFAQGILLREIHDMASQQATTKRIKKPDSEVAKYVWMILGGIILLGFLITTAVAF